MCYDRSVRYSGMNSLEELSNVCISRRGLLIDCVVVPSRSSKAGSGVSFLALHMNLPCRREGIN